MSAKPKVIGPFTQLLSMQGLALKGALHDDALRIHQNAAILVAEGRIIALDSFENLARQAQAQGWEIEEINLGKSVALPGLIDAHSHLCFAGHRAQDYAARLAGKSYLEIAKAGGGIMDSVRKTREASAETLLAETLARCQRHLQEGISTCEVKSGYGLSHQHEIKMLEVIQAAQEAQALELVPTCLAAHMCPPEYSNARAYLDALLHETLPYLKAAGLTNRIDIFVEEGAFGYDDALYYLTQAKAMGFALTVHADQFGSLGSHLAVEVGALSADHLEHSDEAAIRALAASEVVGVVLPGASLGLGMPFAPARKLLDAGACVAIASDWNPGSAPMGDLLLQASVLAAAQKLTTAETLAALTTRAAKALGLSDRGLLAEGLQADFIVFETDDYREILYWQGKMKPKAMWKKALRIY